MKITKLKLTNFKRFTDLTLDGINQEARLVVLVGPNGCGKSSVFDAFEQIGGRRKGNFSEDQTYLRKNIDLPFSIELNTDKDIFNQNNQPDPKNIYIRSAYRFDSDFKTNQIGRKDDVILDVNRPHRLIDLDRRVQDDYERLVGSTIQSLYSGAKDHLSVTGLREELIGKVRESMGRVFPDLILEGIGDPFTDGQFFFTKGSAKNFPYKNLSAGEKGAFDIILDLIIKSNDFNDTVFVIDEPELHMHSRLQQSLLKELNNIIPESCQLWIATHSIGFIRAAMELKKVDSENVVLFDFDDVDFDQPQVLKPIDPAPDIVRKMFAVALDDLSKMVTPEQVFFCEGSLQPNTTPEKRKFDARVYNTIFSNQDVLFFAADNKAMAQRAGTFLLKVVTDCGAVRKIKSIVDRDQLTVEQIAAYKAGDSTQYFLSRNTIENYLFDPEVVNEYCKSVGLDENKVTSRLVDPVNDDAKAIQGSVMQQCSYAGNIDDFKLELAKMITPDTDVYKQIKLDIGL